MIRTVLRMALISSKDKKVEIKTWGGGIPFFVPSRYDVLTNDFERQRPIVIELSDLNEGRGMPKNFTDKRGRIIPTLDRYWTDQHLSDTVNGARDIE
jgi:hypothetical protein